MTADDWTALSEWHGEWLAAAPDTRAALLAGFASDRPHLHADAEHLVRGSQRPGTLLDTPAFLVAARELADADRDVPAGTTIGPYRVVRLLARGGMGDVYRATDVRLGRDVALKLLQVTGQGDTHRLERFVQEARVAATLDHPHIVRLFDVGVHEDRPFIVWELLEGETLRARLNRGLLPAGEAHRIAHDLSAGLAAAHAAGLVHRDLKPENVFLTVAGTTKVLDFGIAKMTAGGLGADSAGTLPGVLLGTVGYLSPEQIRGEPVDARTDLFALGAMLYEMLSGTRAFAGSLAIDTLHAILYDAAPALPPSSSAEARGLAPIIGRLLEKSPAARFQTASDLEQALAFTDASRVSTSTRIASHDPDRVHPRTGWRTAAVALVSAALLVTAWLLGRGPAARPADTATRLTLTLPSGVTLASAPALSPDGRAVAFIGKDATTQRLYVRELAEPESDVIADSTGARHPFWAPDAQALAYFARGRLWRTSRGGGASVALTDASDPIGGAWGSNGTILFTPQRVNAAIWQVPARGGPAAPATRLGDELAEPSHRWPVFLPDGNRFLYFVRSLDAARTGIYLGRLDAPAAPPGDPIHRTESDVIVVTDGTEPMGTLVYAAGDLLMARRLDLDALRVVGEPRVLSDGVGGSGPHSKAMFSASPQALVTARAVPFASVLVQVARDGREVRRWPVPELQNWPRVSPDGTRLGWWQLEPASGASEIWVEDLVRGSRSRISGRERATVPIWMRDGRSLAYRSGTATGMVLRVSAADGSIAPRTLVCPRDWCDPSDVTPDGRALVVTAFSNAAPPDIWLVPVDGAPATPLIAGPAHESDGRITADGQWLAYVSNENGRAEIVARRLSGAPQRIVLSVGGGDQPVWRRDGHELFYVAPDGLLRSVSIARRPDGALDAGPVAPLAVPPPLHVHWGTQYDVSADGQRFYLLRPDPAPAPTEIQVVLDWRALVRH
jgi:serine/threonine protein kinase/Tol biopolymer transport system component